MLSWSVCLLIALGALLVVFAILAFVFRERVDSWTPQNKRILLTGGSSGIGLCTALQLAKEGAAAIAILARDQKKLDEAAALIRQANGATQVIALSADVSAQQPVQDACDQAIKQMGGLDAVVCSAGVSYPSLFLSTPEKDFDWVMQVNYNGIVYTLKRCVPALIRSGRGGRIMLVSSMAGLSGIAGFTAYSASKFALRGLAEALHMELNGPYGIAVSVCNPPDVNTPLLAKENERKPMECKRISEGSGTFEPEQIAADIISAMKHWKFLVNTGMDGILLSLLASGTSPAHSGLWGTVELLSLGIVRTVSLVYRWYYNRIVDKTHAERVQGTLQDAGADAYRSIMGMGQKDYGATSSE